MRQWDSKFGHKNSRWGASIAGLPGKEGLWIKEVPVGLSFGNFVMYDNILYAADDSKDMHAINMENGDLIWSYENSDKSSAYYCINVGHDFIVHEHLVLNKTDGTLLVDLSKEIKEAPLKQGSPGAIIRDHYLRVWDSRVKPGCFIDYSVTENYYKNIILDLVGLNISSSNKNIIGWRQDENSHRLVSYKYPDNSLDWSTDLMGLGRIVLNDESVITVGASGIYKINQLTGEQLWFKNMDDLPSNLQPDNISEFTLLLTNETVHFISTSNSYIISMSLAEGNIIWEKQIQPILESCIAGDLIFMVARDNELIALDRYTGDKIWEEEKKYPWNSVKSHGNAIVFASASGVIGCFDWKEPYISPAVAF